MNILSSFREIDTFIFDVDGVLTDGGLLVLEGGEMARRMNVKDGYALQLAIKKEYRIFIVSGSSPSAVDTRLRNLGITEIHFRVKDKQAFVKELATKHQFNLKRTLFMGDDIPDLPVMEVVALSCCPADAVSEVRAAAKYISEKKGGEGCVRDVIEKVLKLNDHWTADSTVVSA